MPAATIQSGTCECGCGQKVRQRFVVGHNNYAAPTIEERFWLNVDRKGDGECWNWLGTRAYGYGRFVVERRGFMAHRYSYELTYGSIPNGLCVCHRCDNPPCVNPGHLFIGTNLDNIEDRGRKGRSARGETQALAKLTEQAVREIRAAVDVSHKELAERYGVSSSLISMVKRRKRWAHI